jgi:hypothetical protein
MTTHLGDVSVVVRVPAGDHSASALSCFLGGLASEQREPVGWRGIWPLEGRA